MIFINGSKQSALQVYNTLQSFYFMSDLQLNPAKSDFFLLHASISSEELQEIQHATDFKLGNLPFRYLGMPLTSRKLNGKDCQPLIQRITARINSSAPQRLFYAGRLQFIQSVLFGLQTYCCSMFILPKQSY